MIRNKYAKCVLLWVNEAFDRDQVFQIYFKSFLHYLYSAQSLLCDQNFSSNYIFMKSASQKFAGALNIKLHFSIFLNSLILLHSRCFFLLIAVFNKLLYRRNQWSVGGNKGIDFAYSLSVCGINKYWIPICNNLNTYLPMEIPVEIHWWNVLKKKKRNI